MTEHDPTEPDTCRPIDVDGETVLIRGSGHFTEQDQQFTEEVIRAAKLKYASDNPAADPDAQRGARRANIHKQLDLVGRGESLSPSEAELLRVQAGAEMRFADIADSVTVEAKRLLERRTTTLRLRAEQAEAASERVREMAERWVAAGPPPLGTSVSRWWDARLVELHHAIRPPEEPNLSAESLVDVKRLVDEDGEPLCTCTYGERCPTCRD
ncbi:hypothetical protein ACIQAC_01385 [Streptomyces sp. NPDC088387]|uniref:hypothetical protein n=1 Tax=Streptomyces sp. NPDC088387 TaxID=3365859 RepID=UPI00381A6FC0